VRSSAGPRRDQAFGRLTTRFLPSGQHLFREATAVCPHGSAGAAQAQRKALQAGRFSVGRRFRMLWVISRPCHSGQWRSNASSLAASSRPLAWIPCWPDSAWHQRTTTSPGCAARPPRRPQLRGRVFWGS